jgi:iron-sulfur cluster repair protein YtfE (RIC family)
MVKTLRSTEWIRADQKDVLVKLDALQRAVDARDEPEATAPIVQEVGAFFRTGIWTLVWKEEDVLFPAVRPFVPQGENAIAQMCLEHAELRRANDRFQSAIDAYLAGSGNGETTAAVRESVARIVALLRNHIPAEDKALLALADAHLGEAQDQRILDTFKTIDADLAWGFENLQEFYP